MHKIKKGIKKKIKGKKGKKDEDDLFDPDQLAKYKQELEEAAAAAAATKDSADPNDSQDDEEASSSVAPGKAHEEDEEWKKFKALTSGVDSILNKATGDLDRIKSTSFFQRTAPPPKFELPPSTSKKVPPQRPEHLAQPHPTSTSAAGRAVHDDEEGQQHKKKKGSAWVGLHSDSDSEEHQNHQGESLGAGDQLKSPGAENLEDKEPQSPDVDPIQIEDDLFDTSFVDAVATGEIKLAYVPDSPVEEVLEDDPFDTTCAADIVKKIEEEEKKKKRQVNLGIAVNVLTGQPVESGKESGAGTGRVPVSLSANNASLKKKRRPRPHAVNLLGDFDDASGGPTDLDGLPASNKVEASSSERPTDLFDSILASPPPEEIGVELTIPVVKASEPSNTNSGDVKNSGDFSSAHNTEDSSNLKELLSEFDVISEVPETLGGSSNLASLLDPQADAEDDLEDEFAALAAESLHKTHPDNSSSSSKGPPKRPPPPAKTDNNNATTPISPIAGLDDGEPDPFDTAFVENIPVGKSELKIIEGELLEADSKKSASGSNNNTLADDEDDFDFNPRAGEEEHQVTVVPSSHLSSGNLQKDLLGGSTNDLSDLAAVDPIHPVSEGLVETEIDDPFDTSVVEGLLPGRAELKLLEAEFLQPGEQVAVKKDCSVLDTDDFDDFDPRKDEVKHDVANSQQQQALQNQKPQRPPPPAKVSVPEVHPWDLSVESEAHIETCIQTLVPQTDNFEEELDPFDTSAATAAILPGKLELKILESELVPNSVNNCNFDSISSGAANNINTNNTNNPTSSSNKNNNNNSNNPDNADQLSDSEFDPRAFEEPRNFSVPSANLNNDNNTTKDILDHSSEELIEAQTLTPIPSSNNNSNSNNPSSGLAAGEDEDPFDTSHLVEEKILPGKAELKYLESELLNSSEDVKPPSLPVIPVLQASTIETSRPKVPEKVVEPHPLDHFDEEHHNSLGHLPTLQPLTSDQLDDFNTNFADPFDTSIANSIVPGKAELKILEAELGFDPNNRRLSDPEFNPREGCHPSFVTQSVPLIPLVPTQVSQQQKQPQSQQPEEEIDPFDTSAVNTVLPGKTELKMLEAELL